MSPTKSLILVNQNTSIVSALTAHQASACHIGVMKHFVTVQSGHTSMKDEALTHTREHRRGGWLEQVNPLPGYAGMGLGVEGVEGGTTMGGEWTDRAQALNWHSPHSIPLPSPMRQHGCTQTGVTYVACVGPSGSVA